MCSHRFLPVVFIGLLLSQFACEKPPAEVAEEPAAQPPASQKPAYRPPPLAAMEDDESPVEMDPIKGGLVVFLPSEAAAFVDEFLDKDLSALRQIAKELDVPLVTRGTRRGAPAEVSIAPLIVYQNHLGRSIYQGRYRTLDRVKTFVRSARYRPQPDAALSRESVPAWKAGRATIVAPLKIARVTGTPPADYNHDAFEREALQAIYRAFGRFRPAGQVELGRGDRQFYMDFYPWRSESGELYLSIRLFSQFHCHTPIYNHDDKPLVGPWEERERLFREAALALETAVVSSMNASPDGDAFVPVASTSAEVSWDEIGLALPPTPANAPEVRRDITLPRQWVATAAPEDAPPLIRFHFAAPVDNYAGEVRAVDGWLTLGDGLTLRGARGEFTADPATVTMGDPDLDKALQGGTYLNVAAHPTSTFRIGRIAADGGPIGWGELRNAEISGEFEMKGVKTPLSALASFEPVIVGNGEVRLRMDASFQISTQPFGLTGPDGPEPAVSTMLFEATYWFKAGEKE